MRSDDGWRCAQDLVLVWRTWCCPLPSLPHLSPRHLFTSFFSHLLLYYPSSSSLQLPHRRSLFPPPPLEDEVVFQK